MKKYLVCFIIVAIYIKLGFSDNISKTAKTDSTFNCGSDEWIAYRDEKCFKLVKSIGNSSEAEEVCNKERLQTELYFPTLVSIKSAQEQEELTKFVFETSGVVDNVWIGASRKNGVFVWNDNSILDYSNWDQDPLDNQKLDCAIMQSGISNNQIINQTNLFQLEQIGKWRGVSCQSHNYVLCQKLQTWSFVQLENEFFNIRKDLNKTKVQLNETNNKLTETTKQLIDTQNNLANTNSELEKRFDGIEGAFMTTFEVNGTIDYYYPVAFPIHSESADRDNPRTPLVYDIYRAFNEKALESLNVATEHYMGLSLKLMCTNGAWDAGANVVKVMLHSWIYNKGVAKVQLFNNQEGRLFVWLRGGGVRYHIRSPVNITENNIKVYYLNNSPAEWVGNQAGFPPITVSPIALGNEDINLVKPGAYEGWGF